eukprot:Em0003g449a
MPSRNRKKRSKQRAKYLQKQDDILSQDNKAKARARYKADPEKKKASVRDSYKADPEKKASVRDSYKADPEKKKASVRDSYKADPEKKKASVCDSYNADIESKQSAKRQRYQEDVEENCAAKRQRYEDNSAAIKASERNQYWNDPAVRLAKRAAERQRYRRGHRTATTTQSYSLYEPKSHALMEYNGGLEKAILRDTQKVVTRSARAAVSKIGADALVSKALSVRRAKAGSLLKTIREVNALKLEENDILVGHGYHTAGSEPYFFINSYTYTKRLGAIPVDLNGRCVVAEEIGDRDKDTMRPLKWKCTNECRKLTSEEVELVVRTKSLFQMSIEDLRAGLDGLDSGCSHVHTDITLKLHSGFIEQLGHPIYSTAPATAARSSAAPLPSAASSSSSTVPTASSSRAAATSSSSRAAPTTSSRAAPTASSSRVAATSSSSRAAPDATSTSPTTGTNTSAPTTTSPAAHHHPHGSHGHNEAAAPIEGGGNEEVEDKAEQSIT